MTYFKSCEHHLFENNCEKLRNLLVTNFNIFKSKHPLELNELTIKMNSFKNEIWWTKEDRELLFLRISLRSIVIYLDRNARVEAYDENQSIENCGDHISLMNPIIVDDRDNEILNILETVFGMKSPYHTRRGQGRSFASRPHYVGKWLSGFDIETRKI